MRKLLGIRKKKQAPVAEMTGSSKSSSSIIINNSNEHTLNGKTSQKAVSSVDGYDALTELMMPKPRHAVPPTRAVLESHEGDKTQVDLGSPPSALSVTRQQDSQCGLGHQEHWQDDNASASEARHETSNYRKGPEIKKEFKAHREPSPQPTGSEDSFRIYESALESPLSASSISFVPTSSKISHGIIPVASISEPTMSTTTTEQAAGTPGRQQQRRRRPTSHFSFPTIATGEAPSKHYYCPLPIERGARSETDILPPKQENQVDEDDEDDDVMLAAAAARMMLPPPLPPPLVQAEHAHDSNMKALQYHVAVIKQQCELERVEYEKREREHRAREREMLKKISDAQRKLEYTLLMQQEERDAAAAASAAATATRTTTPRPRSANDSGYWDRNGAPEYDYTVDDDDAYVDDEEERYFESWRPPGRSTSAPRMPPRRRRSTPRIPPMRRQRSWRYVEDRDLAGRDDENDGYYMPDEYEMYADPQELELQYPHPRRRSLPRQNAQVRRLPAMRVHPAPLRHPPDYDYYYYHHPHPHYRLARPWE